MGRPDQPARSARMATLENCPRCRADRLAVVYYDAEGNVLGGHCQCPECGPRHAEPISPEKVTVRKKLLEKKAS